MPLEQTPEAIRAHIEQLGARPFSFDAIRDAIRQMRGIEPLKSIPEVSYAYALPEGLRIDEGDVLRAALRLIDPDAYAEVNALGRGHLAIHRNQAGIPVEQLLVKLDHVEKNIRGAQVRDGAVVLGDENIDLSITPQALQAMNATPPRVSVDR